MKSSRAKGWTPIFLIVKSEGKIVGTAPLMTRTHLGLRYAEFLPEDWLSPDFVVDDGYREACIGSIFEYLFEKLNCQFVKLYLPIESRNLKTVKHHCEVRGDGFSVYNQSRHCVLPVDCSWEAFEGRKGRRRKIRQIERKLDRIAPWEIEYVERLDSEGDVLDKILDVEKRSWKESFSNDLRNANLEQLLMALEGSKIIGGDISDFKCSVWLLHFNHKPAAYTLAFRYKGTGYIIKTSYDKKYTKSYVGKYINNVAIRDIFNEGYVKTIDFMAAYPFMSFWTSTFRTHIGFSIWKGKTAAFMWRLRSNNHLSSVWDAVFQSSAYVHLKRTLEQKRYREKLRREGGEALRAD